MECYTTDTGGVGGRKFISFMAHYKLLLGLFALLKKLLACLQARGRRLRDCNKPCFFLDLCMLITY